MNDGEQVHDTNEASSITKNDEQGRMKTNENKETSSHGDGKRTSIDELMKGLNKKQRRKLQREYERQGNNSCL